MAKSDLFKQFKRQFPEAIESTLVFGSKSDAEHYAKTDPTVYPGQIISFGDGVEEIAAIIQPDLSLKIIGDNDGIVYGISGYYMQVADEYQLTDDFKFVDLADFVRDKLNNRFFTGGVTVEVLHASGNTQTPVLFENIKFRNDAGIDLIIRDTAVNTTSGTFGDVQINNISGTFRISPEFKSEAGTMRKLYINNCASVYYHANPQVTSNGVQHAIEDVKIHDSAVHFSPTNNTFRQLIQSLIMINSDVTFGDGIFDLCGNNVFFSGGKITISPEVEFEKHNDVEFTCFPETGFIIDLREAHPAETYVRNSLMDEIPFYVGGVMNNSTPASPVELLTVGDAPPEKTVEGREISYKTPAGIMRSYIFVPVGRFISKMCDGQTLEDLLVKEPVNITIGSIAYEMYYLQYLGVAEGEKNIKITIK